MWCTEQTFRLTRYFGKHAWQKTKHISSNKFQLNYCRSRFSKQNKLSWVSWILKYTLLSRGWRKWTIILKNLSQYQLLSFRNFTKLDKYRGRISFGLLFESTTEYARIICVFRIYNSPADTASIDSLVEDVIETEMIARDDH